MGSEITIIGDGGWGTALALVLDRNGHDVVVWGIDKEYLEQVKCNRENFKFLPGVKLPESITFTANIHHACSSADGFVIAVPSRFYVATLERFAAYIKPDAKVVTVSKGLLDGKPLSEMAMATLSLENISALSGPSHAEEVAQGIPAAVTVASTDPEHGAWWQSHFNNRGFRVYRCDDIIGVELGGAMKNVIAIAAGICDGIGYGDNAKAALITRGLAEMTRLGIGAGAQAATFSGLSGLGDLIVTCTSRHSRNRGVGERLGKGESIQAIMDSMTMVAEGVHNCQAIREWAHKQNIDAPIAEAVCKIIHEGWSPRDAVEELLSREPREE